jgi:hypothetical protein
MMNAPYPVMQCAPFGVGGGLLGTGGKQAAGGGGGPTAVVSSIAPNVGDYSGDTLVRIEGSGFTTGGTATGATVNGVALTSFLVLSDTVCIGVTGASTASATLRDVVVQHPGGNSAPQALYKYWNPTINAKAFVWLRADLGVSVSDRVDSWTSQLDGADPRKVFSETVANRPLQATDAAYGGKHIIKDGRLLSTGTFTNGNTAQPNELSAVGHVPTGATRTLVDGYDGTTNRNFIRSAAAGGDVWQFGTNASLTSTAPSTVPSILSAVLNDTLSALYVNDHDTANVSGDCGAAFTNQSLSIFCFTNSGTPTSSAGIGCAVAEIVYWNDSLTNAERLEYFTYSGHRYGLPYGEATTTPTISTIDPDVGDTSGIHGSVMTITGTNFVSGCIVVFVTPSTGAVAGYGTDVIFGSSTSITCKPPALVAGTYNVRVYNPNGQFGAKANAFEAWTPAQISGVDSYLDSRKNVTVDGSNNVTAWLDQSGAARNFNQIAGTPTRVANVFGTGVHSINFVQTEAIGLSAARTFASGWSIFWVSKWTSTDAAASWPEPHPLTITGPTAAWLTLGASAGSIGIHINSNGRNYRGFGLNDDVPHLVGWTRTSGGLSKAYVGTAQQGTDYSVTYNASEGYIDVGRYRGRASDDGWIGDVGAFIAVAGVIGSPDHTRLQKWARLSFGVAAEPAVSAQQYPLTGFWRTPYAGSPLAGTASAGSSGTRSLSEATNPPAVGANLNGRATMDFVPDDVITNGTAISTLLSASAWSAWALINVDAINTNNADVWLNDCIMEDTGAFWGFFLKSDGATHSVHVFQWDGASKSVSATISLSSWILVQAKYDGTNLRMRVNSGSWTQVAAGNISTVTGTLRLGLTSAGNHALDGRIAEVGMMVGAMTDAQMDDIKTAVNAYHALAL